MHRVRRKDRGWQTCRMGEPLVTYTGVVYPWQCDQVGHMNVAFYVSKFDEATWQFFTHIGMDGSYFRDKVGGHGGRRAAPDLRPRASTR